MRLPTWDELSSDEEQLDVLEAPLDQPLFVAGPPGSGKTSLAVWRADALSNLHGRIPLITYNRMLRQALDLAADEDDIAIAASTMHSFVWEDYRKRAQVAPPTEARDRYAFLWEQMIDRLTKRGPEHQALVVDEGQDLPQDFFAYASRCVANCLSVFADDEQAIGESRATLEQIKVAANLPDPMILTENHRNTPEIARLAEHFHRGRLPAATVVRPSSGDRPQLVCSPNTDSIANRVLNELRNRAASIGVIIDRNTTGREIRDLLRTSAPPGSRIDMYSNTERNDQSIDVRKPGVTVLNKESVKGQEFDTVFLLELDRFIPCMQEADYRAMYMLCTRARDRLFLVYGPRFLSPEANAALPDADILERTVTTETKGLLPEPDWFGLVVDNRRLFDALQDGWLTPPAPQKGVLIGVDSFAEEPDHAPGNRIPVRVRLDTAKLPDLEVNVFRGDLLRGEEWYTTRRSLVMAQDRWVYWPGVLPMAAIRDLGVASDEHRERLLSMARRASNISVPELFVRDDARNAHGSRPPPPAPLSDTPPGIAMPPAADSIRGAMTMALWAVPGIDPWMDMLVASLSRDGKGLAAAARAVEAPWWRFPPWVRLTSKQDASAEGVQERLWLAAIKVLGPDGCSRPSDAAGQIAEVASLHVTSPDERSLIESWCQTTHRALRSEVSIQCDAWESMPVGLAIQMALTRPEPTKFKTWLCDDKINLPPRRGLDSRHAVWPIPRLPTARYRLSRSAGTTGDHRRTNPAHDFRRHPCRVARRIRRCTALA